ncbi:MAG: hypothetical protein NT016_01120 [Candidatus Aenigmarchaeota archaeon]|nr:hypothetical protein [Candidatus Aenigmarchaeota archaeon]
MSKETEPNMGAVMLELYDSVKLYAERNFSTGNTARILMGKEPDMPEFMDYAGSTIIETLRKRGIENPSRETHTNLMAHMIGWWIECLHDGGQYMTLSIVESAADKANEYFSKNGNEFYANVAKFGKDLAGFLKSS